MPDSTILVVCAQVLHNVILKMPLFRKQDFRVVSLSMPQYAISYQDNLGITKVKYY